MKLLQFLFKYFLFRSTRRVENIERVIRAQGFEIYPFCLGDQNDPITDLLIHNFNAYDFAKHHKAFACANRIQNGVFIKDGLCERDRVILLFHEMAHIWYNHMNLTGFVDQTDTQQEEQANLFLYRLRALKVATFIVLGVGTAAVLKQILGG